MLEDDRRDSGAMLIPSNQPSQKFGRTLCSQRSRLSFPRPDQLYERQSLSRSDFIRNQVPLRGPTEFYEYQPLPGPDYIRVLILHLAPALYSPVVCDIDVLPLVRQSNYGALSYSWGRTVDGDASSRYIITVAGKLMTVTQNLFEGLQRLRSRSKTQPVWIDAVCINQRDVAERNSQVSRMAKIYAYATQVVAWLGEGRYRAEDTAALAILKCLKQAPHAHNDPSHAWRTTDNTVVDCCGFFTSMWEFALHVRLSADTTKWLHENGFCPTGERPEPLAGVGKDLLRYRVKNIERVLGSLLRRRYFSRRWIVQEIFHARQDAILLAWGPCLYSADDLMTSLDHLQRFLQVARKTWLRQSLDRVGKIWEHDSSRSNKRATGYVQLTKLEGLACDVYNILQMKTPSETRLTLHNALYRCSKLECADPRDILFALVSLDPSFGIQADYRLTLVLHNLRKRDSTKNLPALALESWVPDLRHGFVDTEAPYASLQAQVSAQNIVTCCFYILGIVKQHGVQSLRGEVIRNDDDVVIDKTAGHTVLKIDSRIPADRALLVVPERNDLTNRRASGSRSSFKDKLHRRLHAGEIECWLPNNGATSHGIEAGDLICTTRRQWWNSDFAQIVVLRASYRNGRGTKGRYKIVQVLSSAGFKPYGLVATSDVDTGRLLPPSREITVKIE